MNSKSLAIISFILFFSIQAVLAQAESTSQDVQKISKKELAEVRNIRDFISADQLAGEIESCQITIRHDSKLMIQDVKGIELTEDTRNYLISSKSGDKIYIDDIKLLGMDDDHRQSFVFQITE